MLCNCKDIICELHDEEKIKLKEKLIAYKGGKCQNCGYDKNCPSVYDFHNKDLNGKDFEITSIKSFKELKVEIEEYELLCCRCHAEIHDDENELE